MGVQIKMNKDKNIKNTDMTKAIKDATFKTTFEDYLPIEIEDKIQLVADINPNQNRNLNICKTSQTGGATLLTTDKVKDFYLTNVSINASVPAGGAGNPSITTVSDDGSTLIFALQIQGAPANIADGSAGNNSFSITFPQKGVLLRKNTTIATAGGGVTAMTFVIAGYYVDNTIYTQYAGASS